jgi:hypothetical protein
LQLRGPSLAQPRLLAFLLWTISAPRVSPIRTLQLSHRLTSEAVNSIEKFRGKFEANFRAVEAIVRDYRQPEVVRSLGIPSFDEPNITVKYPRYPMNIGHFKSFLAFLINEEITGALTTGLITAASLKKHFRFRPGCSTTE